MQNCHPRSFKAQYFDVNKRGSAHCRQCSVLNYSQIRLSTADRLAHKWSMQLSEVPSHTCMQSYVISIDASVHAVNWYWGRRATVHGNVT